MAEENFVVSEFRKKAELYQQRNELYGDNYKRFGAIMTALFPDGLILKTVDDFNRFGILVQITAKHTRYAAQFVYGGHDDSLDDMAVYAMMLKELDDMSKPEPAPAPKSGYVHKRKQPFGSPPVVGGPLP